MVILPKFLVKPFLYHKANVILSNYNLERKSIEEAISKGKCETAEGFLLQDIRDTDKNKKKITGKFEFFVKIVKEKWYWRLKVEALKFEDQSGYELTNNQTFMFKPEYRKPINYKAIFLFCSLWIVYALIKYLF